MSTSNSGLLSRVSVVHLVSHLHMMTVPALLPLLPAAMDVSFLEIGIALGVFNVVSALCQAPLGFAVDRVGPKRMLTMGLILGGLSFLLVALVPRYEMLLVAMALAGLANGVYHPGDYALLSHGIDPNKMGRAYSVHTFAGFLGGAIAPVIMVTLAVKLDLRWAFAAASFGAVIGAIAITTADCNRPGQPATSKTYARKRRTFKQLLASNSAIIVLTFLFMMLSLSTGAIERFSVAALVQGFSVPLATANIALTSFLFAGAFGVLAGGVLADRTVRHGMVAAGAFALAALLVACVALLQLSDAALIVVLGLTGFLTGIVAPSRDMLVRAASPAGQEGRTFGIVSTGFNIGGVVGPVLFGLLLDHGLGPVNTNREDHQPPAQS